MTTQGRRAGVHSARVVASDSAPTAIPRAVQIFALLIAGIRQLLSEDSAGSVYQLTPTFGPARMSFYMLDDFLNTTTSSTGGTGSATSFSTGAAQGSPGVVRATIDAVADLCRVLPASQATSTTAMIVGGDPCMFEGRVRTATAQDGSNMWSDRLGLGDATTTADATNGVYLESDRNTYGDNDYRLCAADGGVRTKTTTGVAPTAGSFQRWKIEVNAAGTSVQAYLNDSAIGTAVTAHIPTGPTGAYWSQLVKTVGSTARVFDLDYFESYQIFSAPRTP